MATTKRSSSDLEANGRVNMKIAVVGSGISGLTTAYYLSKKHEVTVFEKKDYIGGHTNTVDVKIGTRTHLVDTGFIVFNDKTYPRFKRLLRDLEVSWRDTEMSFSVSDPISGLEYNGHTLNTLFAQRKNLLKPKFYRLLAGILRFNKAAKQALYDGIDVDQKTLGEFLGELKVSEDVSRLYLLPMISAIWSSSIEEAEQFPLGFFLRFFENHGLLNVADRPQWHTINGGSKSYIPPMIKPFEERLHLKTEISSISRQQEQIQIQFEDGSNEYFDEVVIASHSDQALRLLADPSDAEQQVLGAIEYSPNDVVLHTDVGLLPKEQRAWASWNYLLRAEGDAHSKPSSVTYNMNILQGFESLDTLCVTLNNTDAIDPAKVLRRFQYDHPQYTIPSLRARDRRAEICGQRHTHFCGAYWYNGFHEDGVRSAIDVVNRIDPSLAIDNSGYES